MGHITLPNKSSKTTQVDIKQGEEYGSFFYKNERLQMSGQTRVSTFFEFLVALAASDTGVFCGNRQCRYYHGTQSS
jgi:hypothetical protein